MSSMIFAIETSCDETSASILRDNQILSNVTSSQLFHTKYGGIVPELASRAHISCIDKIASKAFEESGIDKKKITLVAATKGPGLIGSLLVGYNYAKAFSIATRTLFQGINHIESHLYSSYIGNIKIEFPFIALVVSGGHTILFLVTDYMQYKVLGQTQDDAAGEAFDKTAKMLGLEYPGGPLIDKLAEEGNEDYYKFPTANVKHNVYDFSFSGIKTSVLYFLKKKFGEDKSNLPLKDISASFQKAIVETLLQKTLLAAKNNNVKSISVSGGVSANSKLREEFNKLKSSGFNVHFPEKQYSTDNAAMIGYTAYLKHAYCNNNNFSSLLEPAFARLDYGNI